MRFMPNWSRRKNTRNRKANKSVPQSQRTRLLYEPLEPRAMLAVATFVDGISGYTGTQDTVLYSREPSVNFGTETGISVDQQDAGGVRQGLLRYDDIIGPNPGQIPFGSIINSATLTVSVFNDSNTSMQMSMYRMLTNWQQDTATWNSFGQVGGVNASEGEVEGLPPDAILFDSSTGVKTFDVKTSLEHWAAGETDFGWLFESAATNGWDFDSSEGAQSNRPILTVDYTAPSGAGQFRFLILDTLQTEGDSGTTTALLEVSRVGGSSGAVTVDYGITAGTAVAGVDFVTGTGQLAFADGETIKTLPVVVNGDTALDGLATVNITLSNAQGGATIGTAAAKLTIADDDALISEILANVTNAADETNREYIELVGTPGASLNGYYFVVFESEEEENTSTGSGRADFVLDLTGQTFGTNGILVITPTAWAYTPEAGTNVFATAALDAAGGVLEDSSQTYSLIRSTTPIVQGTDYDIVGTYENATAVAIGVGVGILDQLPVGAQIVDTVGVVEGGGGDRDRMATLAHPGIHVHQPDGLGSSNTSSDAVTRRFGERAPNSIGVWYNGDIPNGTTPLYANGTTSVSVVTPAGAQLTPGARNILRTVGFTASSISVDEVTGTVSVTITRQGDTSTAISVNYATASGTATTGLDFTAESGPINFAIGESSQTIDIALLPDSVAEGFEDFTITLSGATTPFQVVVPTVTVTIVDANVLVRTFQDNVNGYEGTSDVTLNSIQPNDPFGFTTVVSVDEEVGALTGQGARPAQALLRFDNLFGNALNQVPAGSEIFNAFLTLNVNNPSTASAQVRLFRMLQDWDEGTATFADPQGSSGSTIVNGVTPDDVEATSEVDTFVPAPGTAGLVNIRLDLDTIQAWANGALPNFGWSIISDSGNDWNFNSSDGFVGNLFPKLTILYTAPSGQGTFSFSDSDYKVNEDGTASIKVVRSGGSTGAVNVNYQISAGTGALTDITGSATGTLNFADGELFKTISIPINNDSALERNETLNITISGTGLTVDRSSAVLTIRDNDFNAATPTLLLNEFLINSPGNDGTHEFVELAGLASSGLGSLYLVVLDGDVGPGEGSSDLVVDLGSFLNGANGQTVITAASNFDFSLPAGATQIGRPELNVEALANDTATYALLFSPNSSLTIGSFDYDWDNNGLLELPAGVVFVDSITVKDTGADDRSYGAESNAIDSLLNPNLYVPDAISRKRGDTTTHNASSWFHGDLVAAGDDPLVYDAPNFALGIPTPGAALTPGEINTGTTAESPLVSLVSITPNAPIGTVTLSFNGPISQVLDGGGAFGVSITKPDGQPFPQVDVEPVIAGLFTNTLTLSFTGPAVVGGNLPDGSFRLNFVGNSLIGNGRAVDAAITNTPTGSNFTFDFTVVTNNPPAPGGLSAAATAANKIQLAWTDNSTNETGFRVERSTGGPFTTLATLPVNATSYENAGVQSYVNFTYRVVAIGSGGDSAPSNTAAASTVLELITGTGAADSYNVRRVGALLEVYENAVPGPGINPNYSAELAAMVTGLLTFDAIGGSDALLIDTNGQTALGLNRIAFNAGDGTNTLQITAGEARVDSTSAGGTLDTTVLANATLLTAGMRQRSLSLTGASAQAKVLSNGGAAGLIVLDTLSIANDAILQINDNDIVLTYDPLGVNLTATIQQYVNNFYSGATGVPLIASQGIIDTGGETVFVAIDNALTGFGDGAVGSTFYDLTLGDSNLGTGFNQVIVRYTWGGDYDLNGVVDALDYAIVDANLNTSVGGGGVGGWQRGDGDFDGMVTALDYSAIDANLGKGGPLAAGGIVPLLFAAEQDFISEDALAGSVWELAKAVTSNKSKKANQLALAKIFAAEWD